MDPTAFQIVREFLSIVVFEVAPAMLYILLVWGAGRVLVLSFRRAWEWHREQRDARKRRRRQRVMDNRFQYIRTGRLP